MTPDDISISTSSATPGVEVIKTPAKATKPAKPAKVTKAAKPAKKPTPAKPAKVTKCRALEVGHAACKCGGNYCGDNITS